MPRKMPRQKPGRSKQNYATPPYFVAAVAKWLGIEAFDFDYAADKRNAKADRFWTKKDDSLKKTAYEWWRANPYGWGWLNPPFDDIGKWAERCHTVRVRYGAKTAMLVPASVGSNWYRDYVHGKAFVLFLNGRIDFIPGEPYPKDCMLVLYGYQGAHNCIRTDNIVWTWRDR